MPVSAGAIEIRTAHHVEADFIKTEWHVSGGPTLTIKVGATTFTARLPRTVATRQLR
jgi:hypothetical protein